MALTEALRFLITSDSAQARGDLAKLGQQTTQAMSGLDKLKGAFGAGLGAGAGFGAASAGLSALGQVGRFAVAQAQQAIGAASDLQQAQGAVKAIFRESAGEVERFGRTAAESVGLSNAAYQQQASVIGALLQNLGQTRAESAATSQQLITIGADLAATFGGTTADAVAAIGSALRGERDPIERYGISIKEAAIQNKALQMGLASTAAELTDQAKATAALALIQEQAASSTGAFARESDTLAGQQQRFRAELENARAELGEALLPAMTELVKVARDVVPLIEQTGIVFGLVADDARDLAGAVDKLTPAFLGLGNASKDASRFGAALKGALAAAPGIGPTFVYLEKKYADAAKAAKQAEQAQAFWGRIDGAVSGAAAVIRNAAAASAEAAAGADGLATSLSGLQKQASGLAGQFFAADKGQAAFFKSLGSGSGGTSAKSAEKALRSIEDATRDIADAQADLQEAQIAQFLTSLGASSDDITLAQIAERDSTRGLADAKRDLVDAQERLRKLREGDAASLLDAEAANIEAQRAFVEAERTGDAVALKRAQADLLRTEEALAKLRDPATAGDLADAEQDLAAAQDRVTRAEIDARRSRDELNAVINRGKEGSRELAEANKQVEQAQRRVEQANRSLIDAQDALNESTSGLGGSVKSANDRFLEGVTAADGWLQKLVEGKVTPEEFAGAVDTIRANLKGVADQAGKTAELDAYLEKITAIYDKMRELSGLDVGKVLSAPAPKTGGSSGSGTNVLNLTVDGKRFGQIVVDSLIQWGNDNGALPVKTR